MVRGTALYGYVEVIWSHQTVLEYIAGESKTETGLLLKLVVQSSVVEVGVREDAVDSSCHGAEPRDGRLLDGDAAGKYLLLFRREAAPWRVCRV